VKKNTKIESLLHLITLKGNCSNLTCGNCPLFDKYLFTRTREEGCGGIFNYGNHFERAKEEIREML